MRWLKPWSGLWLTVLLRHGFGCIETERVVAVQIDHGVATDGGAATEGGAADPGAPFSTPVLVTGLLADTIDVHDPALTGDELEIYLSSETNGQFDIWISTRATIGSPWRTATRVDELSGPGNDIDPEVSADGLILYLSSDRGGAGYRLYVSRRSSRDMAWGAPLAMGGLGDSIGDIAPSVDPGGLFMVFASQRGTVDTSLFSASRPDPLADWENVAPLSAINSGHQDENPALFNNALSLIWSSRRNPGVATSDLFSTARANVASDFSMPPSPLESLKTSDWEGDPWVSQDGHHIVFVSDRVTGVSQIYEAWR